MNPLIPDPIPDPIPSWEMVIGSALVTLGTAAIFCLINWIKEKREK